MPNDETHDLFSTVIGGFAAVVQAYRCRLNTSALWGAPVKNWAYVELALEAFSGGFKLFTIFHNLPKTIKGSHTESHR